MHARMRNNCSNLLADMYLNHLILNALCSCNLEIENAEHVFFRCPKYVNEGISIFRETPDYHPLNLNVVLFGDPNIPLDGNITIFKAVHNYIKRIKIFSNT